MRNRIWIPSNCVRLKTQTLPVMSEERQEDSRVPLVSLSNQSRNFRFGERERDLVSKAEDNMIDEDTTCQLLLVYTSTHTQTYKHIHISTQKLNIDYQLPAQSVVCDAFGNEPVGSLVE